MEDSGWEKWRWRLWAHGTSGIPEGEIPGVFGWIPGLLLWRLLCNRDRQPRPRIVQVHRVSEHHQLQKTMIPYAFKLLNQEVHSLGISMDNKTKRDQVAGAQETGSCWWIQTCSACQSECILERV
jgi:hypothetical protein